jgi:pimeloyl-ACP methyl ester carboxylesterase
MEIEHRAHRAASLRINYLAAGKGFPLLLLHGWPQTSHAWRKVLPLLAADFRVYAPDMPGFGASSKPDRGFDKKQVAGDFADFMETLGHRQFLVAGHDMGGQVAYPLAAMNRERVKALAFIESGLPGFGQERAMDVGSGGSWHFGFNMAGDIAEALVKDREAIFIGYLIRRDKVGIMHADAVTDADIEVYAAAMRQPGAARCMFGYYRELFSDAADNGEFGRHRLAMPVLAVSAEQGYPGGAERTMRQVADGVEAAIVADCGHYVPEEQPVVLAGLLRDFFRRAITREGSTEGDRDIFA